MNEIAHLELLKGGEFTDSFQTWLWAISATNPGGILNILKVELEKPYVYLELDEKFEDIWKFKECLTNYITTLDEVPKTLEDMVTEIVELAEQTEGILFWFS